MGNSFDPVAAEYDNTFSNTAIGKAQRNIIWKHLEQPPLQNKKILELNCGTGEDAIFLARNKTVTATDASSGMLKIVEEKILKNNLTSNCKTILWDMNEPFPVKPEDKFDLIFSNFGGLNCLSPDVMLKLSAELTELLKPGGKMIFVVIGRKSCWEMMYFLIKGKFRSAFRRRSNKPVKANLKENTFVDTYYYSPKEIKKLFGENFKSTKQKPVGFFIPPSYLESYFKKNIRTLRILIRLDKFTGNVSILSNYADHYLIELEKN